jgi:hypothetical protein
MYCLRGHPAAVASINQQRQLEIYQKETNPNYVRAYSHFINGLRISLQQYDEEHKPKGNPKGKPKDEADRRANTLKRGGGDKFKHDKESFEKFKKELKELGMWVEPSDFA